MVLNSHFCPITSSSEPDLEVLTEARTLRSGENSGLIAIRRSSQRGLVSTSCLMPWAEAPFGRPMSCSLRRSRVNPARRHGMCQSRLFLIASPSTW